MRDFGFGFNDLHFSDRVLHIEIISEDSLDSCLGKRRRGEQNEKGDEIHCSELELEFATSVKIKTLNICSLILAEKSPYFHKLFKNGMQESQQRDFTLRINAYEEEALMDLIKFMYNNTLSATTASDLLDVLMVADKFEVQSCMKHCIDLLLSMPMSVESARSYLDLPSSVLMAEAIQPLIDAAKQHTVAHYKDFIKCEKEVMSLPLSTLEIVLSSNEVKVYTEDFFCRFIIAWARTHYPNLEERREILTKHLVRFIDFKYMSCSTLKQVLVYPEFEHDQNMSKLVMEALLFKAEIPYGQHIHDPSKYGQPRRIYKCRPIKVVQLECPRPRCVVFFYLKKDECANLVQSERIYSEPFYLDSKYFILLAGCTQGTSTFSLHVKLMPGDRDCWVDCEFAVMDKSSNEFQTRFKRKHLFIVRHLPEGCSDLFGISWTDFIGDHSQYFIQDCLHLRVELTHLPVVIDAPVRS